MVDRILRADRRREFRFAPLQGETAKRLLPALPADPGQWALIVLDEDGFHDRSDAAIRIARRLGGRWTVLSWLRIVPRFIRDPVYRVIARNRYRWFGRKDACRIPTAAERERFLP
jgi:predicted DCC family thiol-disulfide oxidoreductase YuxK